MILNLLFSLLIILFSGCDLSYAQETIVDTTDKSVPILNDNFKALNDNANKSKNLLNDYFGSGGILNTANGGTGKDFSAVPQNSLIYFSGTGVMSNVGIGTTGYVLTSAGSVNPPFWTNTMKQQLFTSSGTFTALTTLIYLTGCGGGGGGGNDAPGSGASSGSYVQGFPYTTVIGNSYTVTIGGGGASGANAGDTSFDTLTLLGGKTGSAGIPGAAVGDGFSPSGPNGGKSNFISIAGAVRSGTDGGGGGGSPFGIGGDGGVVATSGHPGTGFCAGGGGSGSGSATGGAGANGFILVQY